MSQQQLPSFKIRLDSLIASEKRELLASIVHTFGTRAPHQTGRVAIIARSGNKYAYFTEGLLRGPAITLPELPLMNVRSAKRIFLK